MAKAMEREVVETGRLDSRGPDAKAEVGGSERPSRWGGENQLIGFGPPPPGEMLGEHGHQEGRDRQRAPAGLALRRSGKQPAAHLGNRLGDGQRPPEEVEMTHPQPGDLRPAQPEHAGHVDDRAVLGAHPGCEPLQVMRAQCRPLPLLAARKPHPAAR